METTNTLNNLQNDLTISTHLKLTNIFLKVGPPKEDIFFLDTF